MLVYENRDNGVVEATYGPKDATSVLEGPGNVRVCVFPWKRGEVADPSSTFVVLALLFKHGGHLKAPAGHGDGLKVTTVSIAAARDGVLPFVVEDALDPELKTAQRHVRGCQLAHELLVSKLAEKDRCVVLEIVRVFNALFAAVLLARGAPAGLFGPFDDWRHMLRTRFDYGLEEKGVAVAAGAAASLAADLATHYDTHLWWDNGPGVVDLAVAAYVHAFARLGHEEFLPALLSPLVSLETRVWGLF